MLFLILILIIIILAVLFFLKSEAERRTIKTEFYEIKTDKLSGNHRFVFITDLHSHVFGGDNSEIVERIKELKPEGVFIGGDMLTCGKKTDNAPRTEIISGLLDKLFAAGLPVYYAEGNHETRMFERFAGTYEKWKLRYNDSVNPLMHYLDDGYAIVEEELKDGDGAEASSEENSGKISGENSAKEKYGASGRKSKTDRIRVYGLTLGSEYYKREKPGFGNRYTMAENYIEEKIGSPRADEFTVLLMHSPMYFEEAARWGADLVLSGHFHGGTIRLPFLGGVMTPQLQFFIKECAGRHEKGGAVMIVNRGLGTHSVNIRFNDLPEISCIDIIGNKVK